MIAGAGGAAGFGACFAESGFSESGLFFAESCGYWALTIVGRNEASYDATLTATTAAKVAAFTTDAGIASSNGGPLLGANPPLPLNDLIGVDVAQPFVLDVDRAGVADELARLYDVVLYVEYTAAF